ncbi:hypothetical protein M388_02225 [Mesotoga sp. Brook.08.YT.4.2.5.4.]|nr:hypothetical protein M388_02225 [Mesotoga sp. Brook.08.YT.4.2.5.4.]
MKEKSETGSLLKGSPFDDENMFFVPERGFVLSFRSNHSLIE